MTNQWKVDKSNIYEVLVVKVEDDKPILQMVVSCEDGDGLLTIDDATNIAEQIVDEWNFTCDSEE